MHWTSTCNTDPSRRAPALGDAPVALHAKGQRVHVRPHDGPDFDGTIERVCGIDAVFGQPCYLVRRDKSIVVYGFVRSAYWAPATRVELIATQAVAAEPFDYARFEAQR